MKCVALRHLQVCKNTFRTEIDFVVCLFVDAGAGQVKELEMDPQHFVTLERLRQTQRQDYLRGSVSGSVQATDRLMKELRDIYRSDSSKKGTIQFNVSFSFNRNKICISSL